MTQNFSIRFQVVNDPSVENSFDRVPSIFDGNTTIEVSGHPRNNIFPGPSDMLMGFLDHNTPPPIIEIMDHIRSLSPRPPTDIPIVNLFDVFNEPGQGTEIPFSNFLNQFINQTLQNDPAPHVETATTEMIKELGKYERIQDNNPLFDTSCTICHEKYKKNEGVRELRCKHSFHKKCIDRLAQNRWYKLSNL